MRIRPAVPEDDEALTDLHSDVWDEAYGTGLGHNMLTATIGEEPAFLWVLGSNQRAITFYQGHGFELDGVIKTDPVVGLELRMVRREMPLP